MKKSKISAIFTIIVGLLMVSMWTGLLLTGQVPGLMSPQLEIRIHIITEMLTAGALIVGGVSVIKEWIVLRDLHLVSHGMLIYAVLNSSGYYIDRNEFTIIVLFAIILVGTLLSLILYRRK